MHYLELLDRLHAALQPGVYLEIGVDLGTSLALSRSRSVAIDPAPQLQPEALEGKPWVKLYQQASDEFFQTHNPDAVLEGYPLDFAFIDGLHEFAQVVRDLENVERWGHARTVAVIHDVIPDNAWTASRDFHEGGWTGDVWRIVPFLGEHRPDLDCRLIDVAPTGVFVVTNLNPDHSGMAETAAALDRDFPPDGPEYEALLNAYLAAVSPLPPEALRDLSGLSRSIAHQVWAPGWLETPGSGGLQPIPEGKAGPPRIIFAEPIRGAFRIGLTLTAARMPLLCLHFHSARNGSERARRIIVDVVRPDALHHDLERVALHTDPAFPTFEIEAEGTLEPGEALLDIELTPMDADLEPIPVSEDMAIGIQGVLAEQIVWSRPGTPFVPERFAERPLRPKQKDGRRDAVVFSWFVPRQMPELGEYYLGLLRYYHPDSGLFIGMNHGSDPVWEERFQASGLNVEVRWARPEVGDSWDATGFLTALEAFSQSDEAFDLVWFGHTKGASGAQHTDYYRNRIELQRNFWSRRDEVDRIFSDETIGVFARRFTPWWEGHAGNELPALLRVYRDAYAPLGLAAFDTFFVVRAAIVHRFCRTVADGYFQTAPAVYGASRWFFEMAFPSVATMQGFEPYIDPDVYGEDDPRDDAWLRYDPKQNHRLLRRELDRWRADPVAYAPVRMYQIWTR
jgi:hypothetical protein